MVFAYIVEPLRYRTESGIQRKYMKLSNYARYDICLKSHKCPDNKLLQAIVEKNNMIQTTINFIKINRHQNGSYYI